MPPEASGQRHVRLAYGTAGLDVSLPRDRTTVITPRHRTAASDPLRTVREALRRPVAGRPLRELARPGQRVAISVCDITRPQPRPLMLRAILDDLDGVIRPEDVTVLVATGTHRANSAEELDAMLGADVVRHSRVVNHVARDRASLRDLGMMDDVPVLAALAGILETAAAAVPDRGGVEEGQRTVVDAMAPAARAARQAADEGGSVAEVVRAAAEAARTGAAATAEMEAQVGRAAWVGGRASGIEDAGATAWAVILEALADALPPAA